ncbi:tRNA (adenine-N(1)-)-methyltransferase [Penicillium brasilianum]|uniref:tRNA (adenine(58)-N(1))-methyltransferase catalytic subunit TRM61 n=1 Tax=Penicillium brasilianum TaxID=104259 RepID=A0A1S9RZX0_PENBI|nr:tRNA (adenine-N(1)-)-methyltransferase [Penicillium brasilianum]
MARLLHSLRRVLGLNTSSTTTASAAGSLRARSIDTDFSVFREGDRAVLQQKQPQLTKPLKSGDKTHLRRGHVAHDKIIGSRVWDAVQAHKGPDVRLSLPTLEEYVALTPRLVTPIYSHDANLIVSLLDIHVHPPATGETQPPLEILESGTGHGSLTLHLARAIHAANTTAPPRPSRSQIQYVENRAQKPGEEDTNKVDANQTAGNDDTAQLEWDSWRADRNALIHTVDVSHKFAALAERNVKGFRRGMYAGDVDFYVGPVENWIAEQTKRRTKVGLLSSLTGSSTVDPFLSHAILDMPSAHLRIPHVAPVLRRDGYLVVFMPSITQIGDCVQIIRKQRLPFVQERVIELGLGITSGRNWDVRLAFKKSGADPSSWAPSAEADGEGSVLAADAEETGSNAAHNVDEVTVPEEPVKDEEPVMVCRPKVGIRTMGGGFVGIWRRIEDPSGR